MAFERLILLSAIPLAVAPAIAADQPIKGAKLLEDLKACRAQVEPERRLSCYDQAAARLEEAAAKRDVIVVDREEVRTARRSLFGLDLPTLSIFDGNGGKGSSPAVEEEKEISATIGAAQQNGQGSWVVTLDSGAVWRQTDDSILGYTPRAGMPVAIRRAALGSYIMRVGKWPGFKAKRER